MLAFDNVQNVMNFPKISWYIIAYYLDLVQLKYYEEHVLFGLNQI
jgi:hypothetical protein